MNLFITNREIINNNGVETVREDGGENAGDNLRFGEYHMDNGFFELFPEPQNEIDTNYQNLNNVEANNLKGSAKFFKKLYDALNEVDSNGGYPLYNDVLFFIHGFNTDLPKVRSAFKRLNECYIREGSPIKHIIIFTWPGRSPLIPYHYFDDRKDAVRSGQAFARGINKVVDFFQKFLVMARNPSCKRNIHLMAHSMGNRLLKEVMLTFSENPKQNIPQIFSEIISIAADARWDSFDKGEGFDKLVDFGTRVHVYYNENDKVLDISKYTKNLSNRLGRYGRKNVDSSLKDVIDANTTSISEDLGDGEEKTLQHWYYYTSSEVIEDIINVFKGQNSKFSI